MITEIERERKVVTDITELIAIVVDDLINGLKHAYCQKINYMATDLYNGLLKFKVAKTSSSKHLALTIEYDGDIRSIDYFFEPFSPHKYNTVVKILTSLVISKGTEKLEASIERYYLEQEVKQNTCIDSKTKQHKKEGSL
jgi:two-component SAPR family response regulator